jgi:WD40 repeat protein
MVDLTSGKYCAFHLYRDIEKLESPVYSCKTHEGIINSIDGVAGMGSNIGAPEIVTGGKDGHVHIWDVRQRGKPVASIVPAPGETTRDCWSVAFGNSYNNEERMVCAGYDNGDLKMFDLRNMKLEWEANLNNGICSIEFDRKDIQMNKLVICGLESTLKVFDLRTKHSKKGYSSLKASVIHRIRAHLVFRFDH